MTLLFCMKNLKLLFLWNDPSVSCQCLVIKVFQDSITDSHIAFILCGIRHSCKIIYFSYIADIFPKTISRSIYIHMPVAHIWQGSLLSRQYLYLADIFKIPPYNCTVTLTFATSLYNPELHYWQQAKSSQCSVHKFFVNTPASKYQENNKFNNSPLSRAYYCQGHIKLSITGNFFFVLT